MNRSLTPKEKLTFVFLALIVVLALWYLFFFTPTMNSIAELRGDEDVRGKIEDLKDQKQAIDTQIVVLKKWQEELGIDMNNESDDFPKIADYNNIRELTAELNSILADSTSFSMSFAPISPPEQQEKDCYRRDVNLNFSAPTYAKARSILKKLNESQYGCLLQDMTISETQSSSGESAVAVTATLSFFEYSKRETKTTAAA